MNTVYQQQLRYFCNKLKIDTCPRTLFCQQLCEFLQFSIDKGINIVLSIDSNENMDTGKLAQNLKELHLKEIYNSKFQANTAPKSWF